VNTQSPGAGATADLLATMFQSACAGLAVLRGRELVIEAANDAFEALAPETPFVGAAAAAVCPELARRLTPVGLHVLETGEPLDIRDLQLRLPAGTGESTPPRYFTFRLRRLDARDGDARLWVVFTETTAQVRARRRADLLASFSTGLNSQSEISVVVRRTLHRAVALLGGRNGALWLLGPDGWTLRAEYGTPIPELRNAVFDLRASPTCQRALQSRVAMFVTRSDLTGDEAELFRRLEVSAGLFAPLVASDRDLGLLTMSFGDLERHPDDHDLAFATGLAAQAALALERAGALEHARRAQAAVEASRARLRLLAGMGRSLSTALDWKGAVEAAARLALGRLADWAILDVVGSDGGLRRESVRCGTPSARVPAWAPDGRPACHDPALDEALHAKRARAWNLPPRGDAGSRASPHLASLREAGAASVILAPLVVRGEALGVLTLARADGVTPYEQEDVGVAEDLGTRIALALHDARLVRSAESATKAHGDLLEMASHELRTPLTALKLELGQLARAEPEDERSRGRLRTIQRATNRLTRSVEQLLDIAHIENGDLPLHRNPLDLVALVREAMARASPDLERLGCTVDLVAPPHLPTRGDGLRIRGLVHHLLEHASRLGPGRPIALVLATRHARSTLEVRYQGEPIPPVVRERLVAPLERRAPRQSLAEIELGLWIARWIVEGHGGRLRVRSSPDGGAFLAEFPLDGAPEAAVGA
jgi:K+-sensing histidine kinase KdpD